MGDTMTTKELKEIREGKIFVSFDKENELILEVKNDDKFMKGFIDGFKSKSSMIERWVLTRSGVHTKLEIDD